MKNPILLLLFLLNGSHASAEAIDMRDYTLLKSEITEAEVFYKFGTPDYETVNSDFNQHILSKTWAYIPKRNGFNKWITEFKFNSNGRLISKDRYRAN